MFGYKELTKKPGYMTSKLSDVKVERFQKQFGEIANALGSVGWKVEPGEIFNSGYEGFTFTVHGHKVLVIEQPGAVGLEDHSVGYLSVILGDNDINLIKHRDRQFGDVRLNDSELEAGYAKLGEVIETYLTDFFFDPDTKEPYQEANA